jgi:hypothetical protein
MIPARIEAPNGISNPGTIKIEIYTIRPFTTSVKSPSVNSIAGMERMRISGRKSELTIEKTKPATRNIASEFDSS